MRRLFSVFVLCGAASGVLPLNATAQEASLPKALEPLSRVGRALGLGWGDGYHACDRDCRLPTADLPPRSYAASHALHPHYGQSNRQHWQAAAAANTPPTAYHYPTRPQPQRPGGGGPQFAVPPSVMQEIRSLENDPQQTTPAERAVAPPQPASESQRPESQRPEQQRPEQLAPPAPTPSTPAPPTSVRPADVLPRQAAPSVQVERMQQEMSEELDAMLDSLRDDGPATSPAVNPQPAAEKPEAVDSILDGPLDDDTDRLLRGGNEQLPADEVSADEVPADEAGAADALPLDGSDDLLQDDGDDLLLDDSDDLLLDDQTRTSGFIREPVAGAPRRIPASQRLAQQRAQRHAQQPVAAPRVARDSSAASR